MGLFERIRETQTRARSGPTRNGRIAAARSMMAHTTKPANRVDANATVTAAAQAGARADAEPVIEIGLTVIPDGDLPPYPATITQPVRALLLERLRVGSHLVVKVNPDDPKWIDFSRPGSK